MRTNKMLVVPIGTHMQYIESFYKWFNELFSDSRDNKDQLLPKTLATILMIGAAVALVLLLVNLYVLSFTDKSGDFGAFGDFFGGVLNPILTFLTLFGLIATIVIQKQELKLARIEYEKTADALSTQAVEVTFFNILDLHHKIAENLKVDINELRERGELVGLAEELISSFVKLSKKSTFEGRGAFEEILNFVSYNASTPQEVIDRYRIIQQRHNHVLGHYFRNLYQALKIIHSHDESIVSNANKRKYASILRSQLSTKELALLFINCLEGVSDKGQFKNLLIEYSMLEHLPIVQEGKKLMVAGSFEVTEEMLLEYKELKNFGSIELEKYYGGAFGKNKGVPYSLKKTNKSIQQTADAAAD
ncbi:putative phage abortive infection protein [Vibrio fluvialis]|uniref:putative phage abortive infection protein n=1 Tax=Vibrio fluvialis TaxID=676 RepID=UPI000A459683|nr:putative phage abortive infection protein [Vibrio fluvialis]